MSVAKSANYHSWAQTLANVVSTAVAVAALTYSSITYQNSVHSDSENQARKEWSDYLVMASQNPEFSVGIESEGGWSNKQQRSHILYRRRMFYYMDNVFRYDFDNQWKSIVKNELNSQNELVCAYHSLGQDELADYTEEFRLLISDIFMRCPSTTRPSY